MKGMICIHSHLTSEMSHDWNTNENIQNWIRQERVFVGIISQDEFSGWSRSYDF
jgi:hypothetical protein